MSLGICDEEVVIDIRYYKNGVLEQEFHKLKNVYPEALADVLLGRMKQ